MSFELHFDETGRVVCGLGVIAYPWPEKVDGTRDVANIGPLILLDGLAMYGLEEEWEWLYDSGDFDLQLTKSEDGSRSFLHIHAGNGRWAYELFPAHWRNESPYAPVDGVFLGRWPD